MSFIKISFFLWELEVITTGATETVNLIILNINNFAGLHLSFIGGILYNNSDRNGSSGLFHKFFTICTSLACLFPWGYLELFITWLNL